MMTGYGFKDFRVIDMLHLVLPHMTGGVLAQLWSGPVFGVPGELIWLL